MSVIFPLCCAGLLAAQWSCASTYYSARFGPATNEVMVAAPDPPAGNGARARVLISVTGVRKADSKSGTAPQVEIRMRLENLGEVPARLEQPSLQLLSGDLEPFGAAQVASDDPPVVAPGASATMDLFFPMPEGAGGPEAAGSLSPDDVNFRSLNLRWTLDFDGQGVTSGVTFERVGPVYYHDPFYPGVHWTVGVGFVSKI